MALDLTITPVEVERSLGFRVVDEKPAAIVRISGSLNTTVDDLWNALTDRRRICRWFLPITGRLELDGHFQLEGNANGTINACEFPSRLAFTWEFSGDVSWVEIALEAGGKTTRMEFSHTTLVTEHWNTYGPGALGVGWELALLGLTAHLRQPNVYDPDGKHFATSRRGRAFVDVSSTGWQMAAIASGTDPEQARAAAKRTTAFYTGRSEGAD